jgi:carbamoyltransferase
MIEWGISGNSHDAAIAVFEDGNLVFAAQSERYSGIKNDRDLHSHLVHDAYRWGPPDRVYWYENPYFKTLRQLSAGQGWKWADNNIKKYLAQWDIHAPITYVDHHKSHAAAGYYTSGFDNAAVIVLDAIGEFATFSVWEGDGQKLSRCFSMEYPNSLGLFYSAMTQRVGLKPNEEEYILMGMAAYGDPSKLTSAMLRDFVALPNDDNQQPFRIRKNLHRGCQDWRPDLIVNDAFDIAAATQTVYEMAFERALYQTSVMIGSPNLVLMGGCALNCLANRLTGKYFERTWIMPAPGDSGSAIGAVMAKRKYRISPQDFTPFLGYDMSEYTENSVIAKHLLEHGICGVARNRAEFGPRALGNRSLLADPRGVTIKDRVNEIKQRQQFRPFAPAILAEHVHEYFEMPAGWNHGSAYMQVVARCRRPADFPAVVHRDGTSRVQTVSKDGSAFRALLEEWYALTGCPMLLNTSLNIRGKPMVNDHVDAQAFEQLYGVRVFT